MKTELENLYAQLRSDQDFTFLAVAGLEGLRTTYTATINFETIIKMIKPVPHNPDSKLLVQRETHKKRISGVSTYLLDDYACMPSTGAIVETMLIEHVLENIYRITIPSNAFRYCFDGQARIMGITSLLESNESHSEQGLTVKFIHTLVI